MVCHTFTSSGNIIFINGEKIDYCLVAGTGMSGIGGNGGSYNSDGEYLGRTSSATTISLESHIILMYDLIYIKQPGFYNSYIFDLG